MRDRSRSTFYEVDCNRTMTHVNGSPVFEENLSGSFYKVSELISDTAVSPNTENYVRHTKTVFANMDTSVSLGWRSSTNNYYTYQCASSANLRPKVVSIDSIADQAPSLWNQATLACVPRFSPEMSLVNFLIELKDCRRMFDIFNTRHGILKQLANGHLNLEFGWKPFLRDLKAIGGSLQKAESFLKFYRDNVGKPVDVYGRAIERVAVARGGRNNCTLLPKLGYYCETYVYQEASDVTVYANVKRKYILGSDIAEELLPIRTYLQALGVVLDPQIIWEAIPFSFVADWIIPIGDYLGQYRIDFVKPRFAWLAGCQSVKAERYSEIIALSVTPTGNVYTKTGGIIYQSVYEREPSTASDAEVQQLLGKNPDLELQEITGRKIALSASLLYSRS